MRALAIVHQGDAGPGVFATAAAGHGTELVDWAPASGPPPDGPGAFDAVLVLGGAMHPDQEAEHPWLSTEKALLRDALGAGVPMLGVCLGAELIAEVAGGSTFRMDEPEIGWFDVQVTPEGRTDPVLGAVPERFSGFQWHSYSCEPPPGAEALALGNGRVDAFRLGNAWAIQFHAEVTGAIVEDWLDHHEDDRDAVAAGFDPEPVRTETAKRIAGSNALGGALFAGFLDYARG